MEEKNHKLSLNNGKAQRVMAALYAMASYVGCNCM